MSTLTGPGAGRPPDAEAIRRAVHDLRAPLTVIRGLCEVMARREASPAARRGLRAIDGEAQRLADGLEALARAGRPPAAEVDLSALAASAVARFRWTAGERDVRLRVRGCAGARVRGHAPRLARALDNLLGNALRHCRAGGRVAVTVSVRDGRAHLRVRDDGPGVPPADRERIFLAGERGSAPRGSGEGLGLAIAREVAAEHGGALELAPTGPGATFVLALPLASDGEPPCRAA